jgi:hypothetical protein
MEKVFRPTFQVYINRTPEYTRCYTMMGKWRRILYTNWTSSKITWRNRLYSHCMLTEAMITLSYRRVWNSRWGNQRPTSFSVSYSQYCKGWQMLSGFVETIQCHHRNATDWVFQKKMQFNLLRSPCKCFVETESTSAALRFICIIGKLGCRFSIFYRKQACCVAESKPLLSSIVQEN